MLVNMKELLKKAKALKCGIGAFNIADMEMVMGVVKAAEELNTPIILQIAEVRLNYSPLELVGPLMVAAAKNAKVPVAVHFDHGTTFENIKKALEIGFTSVMFDGSSYPLDENIAKTKEIVAMANKFGASVEAEIGVVGGSEDGSEDHKVKYTSLDDAIKLVKSTGVDALAIAIGNAHGMYKCDPKLNFTLLKEINDKIPNVNLVLHGGSGLTPHDFQTAIANGITKINVATSSFISAYNNVITNMREDKIHSYFDISSSIAFGTYLNAKKHIEIFGSKI